MDLKAAVEKYLEAVGEFGKPMALEKFGVPSPELVAAVSAWEEDYHLNRHIELIPCSWMNAQHASYQINGTAYSAILFRETIRDVLG